MISIYQQERLNDFLEILPENLDKETENAINSHISQLLESISLFENLNGISDENLNEIIRNLIISFKAIISILIKNNINDGK